jgi:hypothetical protein
MIGYHSDKVLCFTFDRPIEINGLLIDGLHNVGKFSWQTRLAISDDRQSLYILHNNEACLYSAAVVVGASGYRPTGCSIDYYHREIYDKKTDWSLVLEQGD